MTSHRRGLSRDAIGTPPAPGAAAAQGDAGSARADISRHRSELRARTGWERAPALHGYTCLIPRIGAVCVGIRPEPGKSAPATKTTNVTKTTNGAKANGAKTTNSAPDRAHAIWTVPTSRPDSLLSRAMFRAAVQLVAYVAPEVLVRVPEDALAYYLNTPLSGVERDTLLWSKLTPAPLRQWAEGMRR